MGPGVSRDRFGFASLGIRREDFLAPGRSIQLGIDPYRIDLITSISDVSFEEAWNDRVNGEIDGVPAAFLNLRLFRRNKRAAGRPKVRYESQGSFLHSGEPVENHHQGRAGGVIARLDHQEALAVGADVPWSIRNV